MVEPISVTQNIKAPASLVWEMVSDLPRMGDWSPENQGGQWIGGGSGPAAGAKFRGENQHEKKSWKTTVTVLDATPAERFSFRSSIMGVGLAEWSYDIEPTPEGCCVTETWDDVRPGWFKPLSKLATGVADREGYTRAGMQETLEKLAQAAETD
ncbi:MAG: SRPBCC family protein [Actinomycetia bacterium]|nr:SRPBCC family protein [Actinomycetes bacterium]